MANALGDELAYMSIAELSGLIKERKLSPVELVDASFARLHERNPAINAFVYLNEEYARQRAREVEQELLAGNFTGPLQGMPTAIKDLADSRPGWVGTLGGIRALKSHVIDSYCNFAERMEQAGAIPLGKTNSPTMGFRGTCDNYLHGPTRNPFDLSRNSGGSSGGSGAAVADGLIPFGEGTDGGGSIRIPAAWCGVYGFKGTSGRGARLGRPQAFSTSGLFTFEGCLTRSVRDTAIVMDAMCGFDPRDPYALPDDLPWLDAPRRSVKGWRIAYSPDLGVFPIESRVREVVDAAARAFEDAGAHVEEVKVEMGHSALELGDLWSRLMIQNSVMTVERLKGQGIDLEKDHWDDLPPEIWHWIEVSKRQNIIDMARDQEMRTQVYDAVQDAFAGYDLLLAPTLACLPVENGTDGNTLGPASVNGETMNRLIGWCPTFIFNFTGHPAASVPAGLAEGKWPVGLQIVGKKYADLDVIAASAAFEEVRPWRDTYRLVRERA
jgi:amidase/aspartyl-tRNA(Asn)/glutamyl-tRNA(Gln) amidotransferase subunit A